MNEIEYLDVLLNDIISGSGSTITKTVDSTNPIDSITFSSKNIQKPDGNFTLWQAIEKLKTDGYIQEIFDEVNSMGEEEAYYYIATFNGRFFKLNGGYIGVFKRFNEENIRQKTGDERNKYLFWITIWTRTGLLWSRLKNFCVFRLYKAVHYVAIVCI